MNVRRYLILITTSAAAGLVAGWCWHARLAADPLKEVVPHAR